MYIDILLTLQKPERYTAILFLVARNKIFLKVYFFGVKLVLVV